MEITYKRNLNQSYMILALPAQYSGYQLHMCRQNRIAGLLRFETMGQEGMTEFWYEITGMRSLDHILESNEFSAELLVKMIETLAAVCRGIRPYLLEEEGILLDPDSIYVEHGTKKVYFAYCPGRQGAVTENFRRLMEYLLTRINHENEQLVLASYAVYQQTAAEAYSLEEILRSIGTDTDVSGKREQREWKGREQTQQRESTEALSERNWRSERLPNKSRTGGGLEAGLHKCMDWLGRVPELLGGKRREKQKQEEPICYTPEDYEPQVSEQPTEYLGKERTPEGILRYEGTGSLSNVTVEHVPFLLGSGEQADAVLKAQGISRLHAKITKEGEDYYIEDMNSMNGTWLNDQMLAYRQKEKLYLNDTVQLGREKFIFM